MTAHVARGGRALVLDGSDVARADAIGLSALLQSTRLAEDRGMSCVVDTSPYLHHRLFDAHLLDEIPASPRVPPVVTPATDEPPSATLARATPLALRTLVREDLALFETWSHDPFLDQMVGSDLLYRCRHLGSGEPNFVASVLDDVTSVIVVVEVDHAPGAPLGFVRLYDIRLVEGLAFLEVVIADHRALRRGWGISAARLLIAWAHDALGIRRIEAKAYAYNAPSINALRRNGFQQEGVLREARLYDGQYWDILVFAMLDREMQQQRQQESYPYMGFWEAA